MTKEKPNLEPIFKRASEIFKGTDIYQGTFYAFIRFLNNLFIILFVFAIFASSWLNAHSTFDVPNYFWLLMFIICPIISTVIVYQVQKKHEFYEWDKIERLKKRKFIFKLFFLVQFFTYLSAFNLICTATLFSDNQKYIVNNFIIISYIFYTLLFFLNSLFPVRLHKKYFDDELIQNNHLASKPENWDWEYIERNSFY